MGFWFVAKQVIKEADVVVVVFDARFPELSENDEIRQQIEQKGKRSVMVLNKSDLISEGGKSRLKERYPDAFFVSSKLDRGVDKLRDHLFLLAKEEGKLNLKVGIVGYPNVGKSMLINALASRRRANVSSVAGTTKGIQFIKVGTLKILDSPGVITLEDKERKLGFIGAKNAEDLKNPERIACDIIRYVKERNPALIKELYGVECDKNDVYEIFLDIAKTKGWIFKKGEVDETRAALNIIRDWQKGKLSI